MKISSFLLFPFFLPFREASEGRLSYPRLPFFSGFASFFQKANFFFSTCVGTGALSGRIAAQTPLPHKEKLVSRFAGLFLSQGVGGLVDRKRQVCSPPVPFSLSSLPYRR